jgi:hypothetical protein
MAEGESSGDDSGEQRSNCLEHLGAKMFLIMF